MDLPLRPVGSVSEVRIDVEYDVDSDGHETQRIRIPSEPFTVAFNPDETEAYIGRQRDVVQVEVASQLAISEGTVDISKVESLVAKALAQPGDDRDRVIQLVQRGLGELKGTVVGSNGSAYPIDAAPREGIPGSPESRGEVSPRSPTMTLPGTWLEPREITLAPVPNPGTITKPVFFAFSTTSFRDSDFGEKALPGPNSQTALFPSRGLAPMSYMFVRGYHYKPGTPEIDLGHAYEYVLDGAGFTAAVVSNEKLVVSFPHAQMGKYFQVPQKRIFFHNPPLGGPDTNIFNLVDIRELDLTTTTPVRVTMTHETPRSRTAAVVGALLTTPALSLPNELHIAVGVGCPDDRIGAYDGDNEGQFTQAEACVAPSGFVYLGRNVVLKNGVRYTAPGDTAEEKFVVAHELGHALDVLTHGGSAGAVSYTEAHWDGELCGCAHVVGANNLHCLQSKMSQAGGYLEGFAHFVATAVMNPDDRKNATFVYYKEFLRPHPNPLVYGSKKVMPPLKVAAGTPVAWQKNRCTKGVESDRSTEYDWMTFLWGIHQRDTSGSIDYNTWMGLVRDGWCGGQRCTATGAIGWSSINANALAKFGSRFDPRMQRMDKVGFDSAVDH